jgi:two-component system LytT family response regulator
MSLQAIIVDDEAPARDRVRDLLARETDVAIAAECANGREAIAAVDSCQPDLLFLDIQMPQVNGFDVLRALPAERLPAVIFTTAYDQHALQAFEVHALDYLLKPFKAARFKAALQRAREHLQKRNAGDTDARLLALLERFRPTQTYATRFVIKTASRVVIVKASEIDWIESAANYALLHLGDKTHLLRETMRCAHQPFGHREYRTHQGASTDDEGRICGHPSQRQTTNDDARHPRIAAGS